MEPPVERPHRHHGQPQDGPTFDRAVRGFVGGDRVWAGLTGLRGAPVMA